MVIGLVLLSAFLHALWNALLKREAEKDVAGAAVIGVAAAAALAAAFAHGAATGAAPFPGPGAVLWSAGAGVFEAVYFVLLVAALERAPLAIAYTVSRGVAILTVWPLSVLWLSEPVTAWSIAGTAILCLGLAAHGLERAASRRGLAAATLCGLAIAGYHLCYKQAMATGADASAVFAVSLAIAFPMNVARLGRERRSALRTALRARPWFLGGLGTVCAASFLLFLVALGASGAGFVLTLRNTSIVFAALLGWSLGERPSRPELLGALLVTAGALVVGASR